MLIGKTRGHSSIDEHLGIAACITHFAVREETHHLSLVKRIQPDFAPVARETIESDTSGVEKVDEAISLSNIREELSSSIGLRSGPSRELCQGFRLSSTVIGRLLF